MPSETKKKITHNHHDPKTCFPTRRYNIMLLKLKSNQTTQVIRYLGSHLATTSSAAIRTSYAPDHRKSAAVHTKFAAVHRTFAGVRKRSTVVRKNSRVARRRFGVPAVRK